MTVLLGVVGAAVFAPCRDRTLRQQAEPNADEGAVGNARRSHLSAASATRHAETLGKFSKICFDTTGSIMSVAGVELPQSVLKCRA